MQSKYAEAVKMKDLYIHQTNYLSVDEKKQKRLREARVAIVGLGGPGSGVAEQLARAGVGALRLIDRDAVVLKDLPQQTLYTEEDAVQNLFKARALAEKLGKINSKIRLEPLVTDFNSHNCGNLLDGVDLVIATADQEETILCINRACFRRSIPWIYGKVSGSRGLTANIFPGRSSCYLCALTHEWEKGLRNQEPELSGMAAGIISSIQAAEAVKILLKEPSIRRTVVYIDLWQNSCRELEFKADPNCSFCGPYHLGSRYRVTGEKIQ